MISLRNSHLTVLLFASNLCFPFTSVSSLQLLEWNGGEETVGNVGGLPELKVYALKFGIHVGRGGRARGHYGNSTA